jgi:hypothetical protein
MIELTEREREEDLIELASEKPKIKALSAAINKSLTDLNGVYDRWDNCYGYWHARWDGQSDDGLKHAYADDPDEPFPWEGSSDTRIRLAEKHVRRHVMVGKIISYNAKIQCEAFRPAIGTRETSQATMFLKWMVGTKMAENVRREIPLCLNWRYAYGACLMAVEWAQEERIDEHELTLPLIDMFIQSKTGKPNNMVRIMETLRDPAYEENYIELLMQISDVLTRRTAARVLDDLQVMGTAQVPVRYTYKSQPRWTAKRLGVDVLFPLETRDLQAAPYIADREWVTREDLISRIRLRDYREDFVAELLKHKGETANATWTGRTMGERNYYQDGASSRTGHYQPQWDGTFKEMYELYHTRYRTSEQGSTCIYETVFNPLAIGDKGKNPFYATHEKLDYDHGRYPYVVHRIEHTDGPIFSSEGIPEKLYTWEKEIKTQCDGRTDLTALELGPPLIVPKNRMDTLGGYPLPRAVLGVDRATDYQFMNLPPPSVRSIEIENRVELRAEEFLPLFGVNIDPELKAAYRQEMTFDILAEYTQVLEHTFMLMQQFEADAKVQAVVGPLRRPFHLDARAIQAQHEIRALYDPRNLGEEYAAKMIPLVQQLLQLDQTGKYDMSQVADVGLEMLDPSLVDRISRPQQEATQQEMKDELGAINSAFNGLEVPPPMHGNHQLRADVLTNATFQSKNPRMAKRLADNPDTVEILQQRLQFFQKQIQQYRDNPEIGRTLATSAIEPQKALPTTKGPSTGGGY